MRTLQVDGNPVNDHGCRMVDHFEQTFVVKVRSMNRRSTETIKDLIEKKFEVVEISEVDGTVFVR